MSFFRSYLLVEGGTRWYRCLLSDDPRARRNEHPCKMATWSRGDCRRAIREDTEDATMEAECLANAGHRDRR